MPKGGYNVNRCGMNMLPLGDSEGSYLSKLRDYFRVVENNVGKLSTNSVTKGQCPQG